MINSPKAELVAILWYGSKRNEVGGYTTYLKEDAEWKQYYDRLDSLKESLIY